MTDGLAPWDCRSDWHVEAGVALCFICTARQRGHAEDHLADPPSHAHHQRSESAPDEAVLWATIGGGHRIELNGWDLQVARVQDGPKVLVRSKPASDHNRREIVLLSGACCRRAVGFGTCPPYHCSFSPPLAFLCFCVACSLSPLRRR